MSPAYEYFLLSVRDVDTPWATDSVDIELSAWGGLHLTSPELERPSDGEVTVANVAHRAEPLQLRLGRQFVAQGSARLVHIDGASAEIGLPDGPALSGYYGYTVYPRWNDRYGYVSLGSAYDDLLGEPQRLPRTQRSGSFAAGARAAYRHRELGEVGLSLHEQHAARELVHRELGFDLEVSVYDPHRLSLSSVFDADTSALAQAVVAAEATLSKELDAMVEYRRLLPGALLPKDAVLSVFATDRLDEMGGELRYRPATRLTLEALAFLGRFERGDLGYRSELRVIGYPDKRRRLLLRGSYARSRSAAGGYNALSLAARFQALERLRLVAEQHLYVYDAPVRDVRFSTVEAASAELRATDSISVMIGGSVYSTPLERFDAQALLRLRYELAMLEGWQ
jgi:hypothetical protein